MSADQVSSLQNRKYIYLKLFLIYSWTNDGQYLAIGLFNGLISIRNKVSIGKHTVTYSMSTTETLEKGLNYVES